VLHRLLIPADLPATPRRLPLPARPRLPIPTTPLSRAALAREEEAVICSAASRQRRRMRGSPDALAEEARRRHAAGVSLHDEAALYRARLARATMEAEQPHDFEEGEPPSWTGSGASESEGPRPGAVERSPEEDRTIDADLLQWFQARNLSSVAAEVCSSLGLRIRSDLVGERVTPSGLTRLAATHHPLLNPLRLRRLKDALEAEARAAHGPDGANPEWEAWFPPPASSSSILVAGRSAAAAGRSTTARTLARHQLSHAEAERVAGRERARLGWERRQWAKRGEQRGQTAHNATLTSTAGHEPGDRQARRR
jgi:hypothetical protein